jgi:DNA-binding NarL/FixJ family response regulator
VAAGASGYLDPDGIDVDQMSAAIWAIAGGGTCFSQGALAHIASACRFSDASNRGTAGNRRLTAQQRRVACLACDGLSNREIAAALSVEVSTVKKHLHAAMSALGVSNRDELRVTATAIGGFVEKRF